MKLDQNIIRRSPFKIRLATSAEEIHVAQKLRYLVFHQEMGAKLSVENRLAQIEGDSFDTICDHLLVIRESGKVHTELSVTDGSVIGTYRLLRQSVADQHQGFYSQAEFDVAPLLARKPAFQFLELGRSCVLKDYRGLAVVELLWQGIWNYVRQHRLDVMIGCASFDGVEVEFHRQTLQYLLKKSMAPDDWQVQAQKARRLDLGMDSDAPMDMKQILSDLPALIKGYMRLGCYFAQDAVIDDVFNTIDVLVILPVSRINPRYFARFGEPTN